MDKNERTACCAGALATLAELDRALANGMAGIGRVRALAALGPHLPADRQAEAAER